MAKKKKKKTTKRKPNGASNTSSSSAMPATDNSVSSADAKAQVVEAEFVGEGSRSTEVVTVAQSQSLAQKASPLNFFKGSREELSKVVWPDRQQLISESAAVILMVSFLAILISLIDNIFSWGSQLIFN